MALALEAPASAQYYPGYADPYGSRPGQAGSVNGYGVYRQIAINECADAAQARLGRYRGGRVLGISNTTWSRDGGLIVSGVATSGGYSYAYGPQPRADLIWRCRTDIRGYIVDVGIDPASSAYRYNQAPGNYDYSQFGYRRY